MALIGEMDLGIGTIAPAAYVRIVGITYRPSIPEVEIEVYNYFNKESRVTEILKAFASEYIAQTPTLTPTQTSWLQNNVLARSAYPLQTLRWASRDMSLFPANPASDDLPSIFYTWLKTNQVIGPITNITDDLDDHYMVINAFKAAHPEIFG